MPVDNAGERAAPFDATTPSPRLPIAVGRALAAWTHNLRSPAFRCEELFPSRVSWVCAGARPQGFSFRCVCVSVVCVCKCGVCVCKCVRCASLARASVRLRDEAPPRARREEANRAKARERRHSRAKTRACDEGPNMTTGAPPTRRRPPSSVPQERRDWRLTLNYITLHYITLHYITLHEMK